MASLGYFDHVITNYVDTRTAHVYTTRELRADRFTDSASQFEDGMGFFLALLLSQLYETSSLDSPSAPIATRVDEGLMATTLGLGKHSRLDVSLILVTLPLLTLGLTIAIPQDYMPSWDVMNPMDALVTDAMIDKDPAKARGRNSGLRLGIVDGRIVASNTNLPTRIAKSNVS